MNNQLQPITFHEDTIFVVDHDGQPFVPVRPICENMGLDWAAQFTKIKARPERFCVALVTTQMPGDDQQREVVCIHLKKVAAWLYSINPASVAPHLKEKVEIYQNECDEVLWNYWTKGVGLPDRLLANMIVVDKDEWIHLLESKNRLLTLQVNPPTGAVSEREVAMFKKDILAGLGTKAVATKHLRSESTVRHYTVEERKQAHPAGKRPGGRQLSFFGNKQ